MLLTPDQFFGKYDQKPIDFDGYYGYQCMDLYRQFVEESLGFPQSPPVAGAVDVWVTYLKEHFDRIDNTLEAIPVKGDIIIWGYDVGKWGHIAVCKDGDQMSFTSFDQNWPSQGYVDANGNFQGTGVCHFQGHSYNGVLGWLRVKAPPEVPADPPGEVVLPPQPPIIPEPIIPPIDPCKEVLIRALFENDKKWRLELETAKLKVLQKVETSIKEVSLWKLLKLKCGR